MRYTNWANRILLLVFCLFLLAAVLKYKNPGGPVIDFFFMVTEAALVGGIADWFAVTALFRRPLGFPWHTALIPRNRARVTEAVAGIVEEDLLSAEAIKLRIGSLSLMDTLIDWVENKGGKAAARRFAAKTALYFIDNLDEKVVETYLEQLLRRMLKQFLLAPRIRGLAGWLGEPERMGQIFIFLLEELIGAAQRESTYQAIYQYLTNIKQERTHNLAVKLILWLGEQTDSVNLPEAAKALQREILNMLEDLRDPEHPVHRWAVSRLILTAGELEKDGLARRTFAAWTKALTAQVSLNEVSRRIVNAARDALRQWLDADTPGQDMGQPLLEWTLEQLNAYWKSFKQDEELRLIVEQHLKMALFVLVEKEHKVVGGVVRNALQEFNDARLVEFIEEKAGDDLQWIRINGSMVGGIVGGFMYLFLTFVYEPWVVPWVRGLLP